MSEVDGYDRYDVQDDISPELERDEQARIPGFVADTIVAFAPELVRAGYPADVATNAVCQAALRTARPEWNLYKIADHEAPIAELMMMADAAQTARDALGYEPTPGHVQHLSAAAAIAEASPMTADMSRAEAEGLARSAGSGPVDGPVVGVVDPEAVEAARIAGLGHGPAAAAHRAPVSAADRIRAVGESVRRSEGQSQREPAPAVSLEPRSGIRSQSPGVRGPHR